MIQKLPTASNTPHSAEADGSAADFEPEQLLEDVSATAFDSWYREREYRENIRNGKPYFNGPSATKPPRRYSPSSLLQCPRKISYQQLNAPAESEDPTGIFWFGSRFETEIAVPFLRDIVGKNQYVTNSIWVDFSVQTDTGDIRLKGETDPVIVDSDAKPLLLTEIKTRRSIEGTDAPSRHHKAQAHAYMKGLSQKYDRQITDAVILYGDRTTLSIRAFHVEFDPFFWRETVLSWAESHTSSRLKDILPDSDPEYDRECSFCNYRKRCGQGETGFADIGPYGLLPGVEYPRAQLVEYLEAHNACLTPTLAHSYPDLAEEYGVHDWSCQVCGTSHEWGTIDWHGDPSLLPQCPTCGDSEPVGVLAGPNPAAQHQAGDDE